MADPTLKELRVLAHFEGHEFAHRNSLKGVGEGIWEKMAHKGWIERERQGQWYRITEVGKMIRALHQPHIQQKFGPF